jgi:GT2 family glycosyltransferase
VILENQTDLSPLVYIVTLNWNSSVDTLAFLESLKDLRYNNFQTLVIDNNSSSNDYGNLEQHSGNFELIRSEKNLGFAGGCNKGIQYAFSKGCEYVWLVNNDARVTDDSLTNLIDYQTAKQSGITSPIILNYDDATIQHAVTFFDVERSEITESVHSADATNMTVNSNNLPIVWGTALLINRQAYSRIGGFDEGFFAYMEDFDLCMRAHQANITVSVAPNSYVHHNAHSGTRPPHYFYYTTRNGVLFWYRYAKNFRYFIKILRWTLMNSAKSLDEANKNAIFLAYWHLCSGIKGEYDKQKSPPLIARAFFTVLFKVLRKPTYKEKN